MIELYPCFKNWKYFSNIWLYSDTHFGDEEMYRLRFSTAFSEHYIIVAGKKVKIELEDYSIDNIIMWLDNWQIGLINSKVGKKDI